MSAKVQSIDVSNAPDLLDLAEDVRTSGVGRILKRGELELAQIIPMDPRSTADPAPRERLTSAPDSMLNIIGIGASTEPTDIANHKQEYLAQAITRMFGQELVD